MGFNLSQGARLGQNLKLSPRMLTTMSVLQLPLGELEERVEQELQENIALERAEPDESSIDPVDARADGQDSGDGADDRALVVEDGGAGLDEDFEAGALGGCDVHRWALMLRVIARRPQGPKTPRRAWSGGRPLW